MSATGMSANEIRLQRQLIQQLESLAQAGVKQLARKTLTVVCTPPLPGHDSGASSSASPLASRLGPSTTVSNAGPPDSPPLVTEPRAAPEEPMMSRPAEKRPPSPSSRPESTSSGPVQAKEPQRHPVASPLALDPERELAVIQREVAVCRRCEHLACARTQTVFGVGTTRPRLCFLGEAPGADEDRQGEPFVGRAGQLLNDIIQKAMGLQRSDVYILNVLKCRPPNNRVPSDEEIANCREYFERQLKVLQPEFICCLGATAVRSLLNNASPLGRLRGQWFEYQTARVIITYHPSYLLRNPAAKKDTWEDIQLLMRAMGLPIPSRP